MNRPDIERIKARWDSIAGLTESGDSILFPDSAQAQTAETILCEDLEAMFAYIASLEAALPRTADGEVIVPGKRVWAYVGTDEGDWYEPSSVCRIELDGEKLVVWLIGRGEWEIENISPCYIFAVHPKTGERA